MSVLRRLPSLVAAITLEQAHQSGRCHRSIEINSPIPRPGNIGILRIFANLRERDFFRAKVVSKSHKVEVRWNENKSLRHHRILQFGHQLRDEVLESHLRLVAEEVGENGKCFFFLSIDRFYPSVGSKAKAE